MFCIAFVMTDSNFVVIERISRFHLLRYYLYIYKWVSISIQIPRYIFICLFRCVPWEGSGQQSYSAIHFFYFKILEKYENFNDGSHQSQVGLRVSEIDTKEGLTRGSQLIVQDSIFLARIPYRFVIHSIAPSKEHAVERSRDICESKHDHETNFYASPRADLGVVE